MLASLTALASTVFFLASHVIATPAPSCTPNFAGNQLEIVSFSTSNRWQVPKSYKLGSTVSAGRNADTTFRAEFTGQPSNDYIIKYDPSLESLVASPELRPACHHRLGGVSDNSILVQPHEKSLVLGSVLPTRLRRDYHLLWP